MQTTLVMPPDGEPLSLVEAKDYLRIGHNGEDPLILALTRSARARLEQLAGLALITRTLGIRFYGWPLDLFERGILLTPSPVAALVSITVASSGEDITPRFEIAAGRLCVRPGQILPNLQADNPIDVHIEVGFGPADAVPEDLKFAVKRLVGEAYRARDTGGAGLPDDVLEIVSGYLGARL